MRGLAGGLILVMGLAGGVAAQETAADRQEVAGHEVALVDSADGLQRLEVDGMALLEDGLILLDEGPVTLGGVTLLTGVAGAGGNACNAAPFVLLLPQGQPARLDGPLDSCAYLERRVAQDALVFAAEPLPDTPAEVWTWTAEAGFAAGPAVAFAADATQGWDALTDLAGAHPVEAMQIGPVLAALEAGLGPDYPAFAERISGLGSGDLVEGGYLGRACLKISCDEDWAALYLHAATEGVFAAWNVAGEEGPRLWPADPAAWPVEAMAAVQAAGQ